MTAKRLGFFSLLTLLHAGLTVLLFLLYVDHAMKVDRGLIDSTIAGTFAQYLKSVVFLPILLPVLRWYPGVATGLLGYVVVLLNSAVWAGGFLWIWNVVRRRRTA